MNIKSITATLAATTAVFATATGAATGATATASAAATSVLLPEYQVQATGLTQDQASALQRAFGLPTIERADDGSVRFSDEAFLNIPTIDRGRGEPDEDGNPTTATALDLEAVRAIRPIEQADALVRTTRALAASGLAPLDALPTASHSTFEVVGTGGERLVSANLDTTVTYSFTLGGLPYQGPGAKIRVAFDGRGAVTQLAYSTRTLALAGTVPVLDLAAGRQRCATALGGRTVRSASYAYEAPALSQRLSRLEPSIRCEGIAADGSPLQVIFVPAAVDAQLPTPTPAPPVRDQLAAPSPAPSAGIQAGTVNVGSEGTGVCSGLDHTGENLDTFNDAFSSRGIPVEFSWLDSNAWEEDWKDPAFGGTDDIYTDAVDMAYWQGHGTPTGFMFDGCSAIDDDFLANTDARWGNQHAEWVSLFTCSILHMTSGGPWWQRWGNAFHGLHQINSFGSVSYHSAVHGGIYANYLLRSNPMKVRNAWAWAAIDDQPSGEEVKFASMGPVSAGGQVNVNDYFWGKGPVGPDVKHSQLTAWWYLTGTV